MLTRTREDTIPRTHEGAIARYTEQERADFKDTAYELVVRVLLLLEAQLVDSRHIQTWMESHMTRGEIARAQRVVASEDDSEQNGQEPAVWFAMRAWAFLELVDTDAEVVDALLGAAQLTFGREQVDECMADAIANVPVSTELETVAYMAPHTAHLLNPFMLREY